MADDANDTGVLANNGRRAQNPVSERPATKTSDRQKPHERHTAKTANSDSCEADRAATSRVVVRWLEK